MKMDTKIEKLKTCFGILVDKYKIDLEDSTDFFNLLEELE